MKKEAMTIQFVGDEATQNEKELKEMVIRFNKIRPNSTSLTEGENHTFSVYSTVDEIWEIIFRKYYSLAKHFKWDSHGNPVYTTYFNGVVA